MNRPALLFVTALLLGAVPACSTTPNPVVVIETSKGDIKAEIFQDRAPLTARNFLAYVDAGHYDGTIFHRVIPDFMVQGGGFLPGMQEKPDKFSPIQNESHNGLENLRGTLAMARTGDPHSATSQFFINTKDNDFLNKAKAQDNWGYAVFGKVLDGMDVVDEIRQVKTGSFGPHDDVPMEDVIIKSVRLVKTGGEK